MPFLVPPKQSTSIPARQVKSAGAKPRVRSAAAELANELAQETGTLVEKLDQGTLTAEEKSQLQKYQDWKEYLENESTWIKLDEEEIVGHRRARCQAQSRPPAAQ